MTGILIVYANVSTRLFALIVLAGLVYAAV
jgi:hypothetical protein